MARSRRLRNRSTSQKAVSLLASGLPAPVQRIAESSIGSKLLLWGIPALLIAGVLHLEWEGGVPHLSLDRQRAAEIEHVAREKLEKINPATIQKLENSAKNLWHEAQASSYPQRQTNPYAYNPNQQSTYQYPPPASNPQPSYQPNYQPNQQPNYQQQYPQPTYAQPTYNQPSYQQPQPYYPQQPTQPPNYQPQQYQSYQQPLQGTWRQ
jgi:hypothetical protein